MYGYIYLTTNLINGKKYIGQHKSEVFDTNYYGSGKLLKLSILKYGVENFKCELLESYNNQQDLDKAEYKYIKEYDAVKSDKFYNLKDGGEGRSVKGCIYVRNLETNKCKKVLPEELDYYLTNGYIRGGPIPTETTKAIRSKSNTGKKRSLETRRKISESLKGRKLSPEHIANNRKANLGHSSYNKGKIQIYKDDTYIFINPDELQLYIEKG